MLIKIYFLRTDLPTGIAVRIVDKEPQLFVVVVLDERVEVVIVGHQRVRAKDVVCVGDQPCLGRR